MNPQILGPAISVLIAWSGVLTGVIRWLQGKSEAALGVRLAAIEKSIDKLQEKLEAMPERYVLKDDCHRQEDQVLGKLVRISNKLDELGKEAQKNVRRR